MRLSRLAVAQGSVEYLVIVAIIIVISLIVVGLSTNIFSSTSTSIIGNSQILNNKTNSGDSGIIINESAVDVTGKSILTISNVSGDNLKVSKINAVSGGTTQAINIFDNGTVALGSNATFLLNTAGSACQCAPGETKKTCSFSITYTTNDGLTKTKTITATLACVNSASPGGATYQTSKLSTPYVWVASTKNNSLFKLSDSNGGTLGTYTNSISFNRPYGIAIGSDGNIWIINYASGYLTEMNKNGVLLGNYAAGTNPAGIALDVNGNIWEAASNSRAINQFSPTGTLLGTFNFPSTGPLYTTFDSNGNAWVAGADGKVYELSPSGNPITNFNAGISVATHKSIAIDSLNNIWAIKSDGNLEKFDSSGNLLGKYPMIAQVPDTVITNLDGNIWVSFLTGNIYIYNPLGQLLTTITDANGPQAIMPDLNGNMWAVNNYFMSVFKYDPSGNLIAQYTGTYQNGSAKSSDIIDMAVDSANNMWVSNGNGFITKIDSSGNVTAVYGNNIYNAPYGIAVDTGGNAWITNSLNIIKVSPDGAMLGAYSTPYSQKGIAIDGSGNVWSSTNGKITKLNSSGNLLGIYSIAFGFNWDIAVDASGNVWAPSSSGVVSKLDPNGNLLGNYSTGGNYPYGVAIDANGNAWVSNNFSNSISKIDQNGTLIVKTSVGSSPKGVGVDMNNNVWVGCYDGNIYKLNSSGTVIGIYPTNAYTTGITMDASGNVWADNYSGNQITELNGSTGAIINTYNLGNPTSGVGDMTGFKLQYFVLGRR